MCRGEKSIYYSHYLLDWLTHWVEYTEDIIIDRVIRSSGLCYYFQADIVGADANNSIYKLDSRILPLTQCRKIMCFKP